MLSDRLTQALNEPTTVNLQDSRNDKVSSSDGANKRLNSP